jgi:hypothetical protein
LISGLAPSFDCRWRGECRFRRFHFRTDAIED